MKTNVNFTCSYDNEFRWAYVFRVLCYACGIAFLFILIFLFSDLVFYGHKEYVVPPYQKEPYFIWPMIVVLLIPLVGIIIGYLLKASTGEYTIVGENLIVHERYFSKTNLTIPIACISEVRYTPYYSGWNTRTIIPIVRPFRFLEIVVDGQSYELSCVTHAKELYDELSKRVNNK